MYSIYRHSHMGKFHSWPIELYSWCKAALVADLGLGTNSQLMEVDTSKATRIGWRTATPAAEEMTPVTIGKMDAPICAKTKTIARAVA